MNSLLPAIVSLTLSWSMVDVTESNAKEFVKQVSTDSIPKDTRFRLANDPSEKLLKQLATIPTEKLLTFLEQQVEPGIAGQILAYKGDRPGFELVVKGYLRGDLSKEDLASAARLFKPLVLPADFRAAIEDTTLPCRKREELIQLLSVKPSAESVSLLEDIYSDPTKQQCEAPKPYKIGSSKLIEALGLLKRPEAVEFLAKVPRCVNVKHCQFAGTDCTTAPEPNSDRRYAVKALGMIGNDAALDALLGLATETYSPEEMATCMDAARLAQRMGTAAAHDARDEKYPWRKSTASALYDMTKTMTPDQIGRAVRVLPELFPSLLNRGVELKGTIEELLAPPKCSMVTAFVGVDSATGDHSFLAGSKAADLLIDLLVGVAAREKRPDLPASSSWDLLRADDPSCVKSDKGYSGLETDQVYRALVKRSGEIADGRAVASLVAIFDRADSAYASSGNAAGMMNAGGDLGLISSARGMRLVVLKALARMPTSEAQTALGNIIKADSVDADLRGRAREALAECKEAALKAKAAVARPTTKVGGKSKAARGK